MSPHLPKPEVTIPGPPPVKIQCGTPKPPHRKPKPKYK